MDFLDPRKKNSRRRRLIASYLLMALLVAASALILVYSSFGYGINTKTGKIVQNGLVFIDSKPGGAEIYLNSRDTGQTTASRPILASPTRLVLPGGDYALSLKEADYRTWQDSFNLDSQSIVRLNYPLLIPTSLRSQAIATFKTPPAFVSQSPDQRWLLVAAPTTNSLGFSEFDTNNPSRAAADLVLPASDIKLSGGTWQVSDWSTDSSNLILEHSEGGSKEFIVFDRAKPAASFNLTSLLGVSADQVVMRGGKPDQFYVYQTKGGNLSLFDVKSRQTTVLFKSVLSFRAYGSNQVLYATSSGAPAGGVVAKIWDGSNSYTLGEMKAAGNYLLAAGNYQDGDYYAYGSTSGGQFYIYQNPLSALKSGQKPVVLATLRQINARQLSFSTSLQFVAVGNSQNLSVYNIGSPNTSTYHLSQPLTNPASWTDNYHLVGQTVSGKAFISDYDGANQQLLVSSSLPAGAYFDSAYKTMFTETLVGHGAQLQTTSLLVK